MRERKKQATREALRDAALRLALEYGPDNVRVEDIAQAAGVSPRTYNNYFSSREQAIVAAVTAERQERVGAAVAARPHDRLAEAVTAAIVEQYTDPGDRAREALLLITTHPALREAFLDSTAAIESPLSAVIAERTRRAGESAIGESRTNDVPAGEAGAYREVTGGGSVVAEVAMGELAAGQLASRVLAAAVVAAVRVALAHWVTSFAGGGGFVVVSGSLPDLLRAALAPLEPALNAAEFTGAG